MDLHNLVTVQYNVTYDQSKLERVIKELQQKLIHFDNTIKTFDQQCQKMKQSENSTLQKVQKLQQFTIDNLRETFNEVSVMKSGLINYLGDQWIKDQQNIPIPSISQLSNAFQSRLSAFNSQTRKLNRKVSIIEEELAANSSLQKEQNEAVNKTINEHKNHINKVRQSIRDEINEKFNQFQKQFEDKNLKEIIQKTQHQCQQSAKLIEQQGEVKKNQLMKALKELKHNALGKNLQISNPPQNSTQQNKGRKFKFDKKSLKRGQNKSQGSDIQEQNKSNQKQENNEGNQKGENTHKIKPSTIQPVLEQQSMEHAINSLRDELKLMCESQMLQFRSGLQSLNARYEKVDSSIVFLINTGKQHKNSITEIEARLVDMKNQIENNKTALYETNEKHNQSLARVIQQEQKSSRLQADLMNLTNQFKAFEVQSEQTQSYLKFKDIQNMSSMNNNKYRNSLPNCITTPNLKDDNIFVQRLNNLSQKISKIEDKLKNGHQGSQKTLPRINSSSHLNTKGSNVPSVDFLRKDIQKSNEEINKTNERLENLKKNLKELEAAHSIIPAKIQKLQTQIRNVNEIQQERLLQLIKELINRVLTDPFNNNFTNTLKRQIHVKFLEIKYEYSSIWKDIEAKVTDRAETTELLKLKENVESQNLQIKSLVSKKADNDDFKKGIKYLDSKLKELYSYLKLKETEDNSPQGRKYYMGKKA